MWTPRQLHTRVRRYTEGGDLDRERESLRERNKGM